MRKGSEENKNQQNKDQVASIPQQSSNPWAIGTKKQEPTQQNQNYNQKPGQRQFKEDKSQQNQQPYSQQKKYNSSAYDQSHQKYGQQNQNNESTGTGANQGTQHRHIPKLKERNPFSVIKQLQQDTAQDKVQSEIKGALTNFNTSQYSISEFMSETLKFLDDQSISSFEIVEFILSQVKLKDYFRDLNAALSNKLINSLIGSMQNNNQHQNKDSCIKLLGHLLFEQNEVDNASIQKIYNSIQKLCFDNQPQNLQSQQNQASNVNPQQSNYKTQRLAINCLANLLLRPCLFLKENCETIFLKLKNIFDFNMRKIQQNFKSKRYISMLTTIIRALQLSMGENPKIQTLNDTECIKLYINFYKLLYLGTPFAEKMLNIKLEETKVSSKGSKHGKKGQQTNQITQNDWDDNLFDDEELKGDGNSFIIDTSEMSSSDGGFNDSFISSKSGGGNKKSPSSNDSITSSDPYQKIKNHAALCLQILLKHKNKSLFNLWYLLFPSFFLRSPTEFTQYLPQEEYIKRRLEFQEKIQGNALREPSLFYILKSKDNSTKLKQTICYIINVLLENSIIQKWQDQLESEDQYNQQLLSGGASFVSISNYLGQFLRYLHYTMIFMIDQEKDTRLVPSYIKTLSALISTTPYSKMNKGLAGLVIEQLVKINTMSAQSAYQINENDYVLRQQVLQTLSVVVNNQDIKLEVEHTLLKDSTFLKQLLKIDKKTEFYQQNQGSKDYLELFNLTQKICKNYPHKILDVYESYFHEFLQIQLKSYDRKRQCQTINIIEEWLKNYKSEQALILEEGDQNDANLAEEEKKTEDGQMNQTPLNLDKFRDLIRGIVTHNLLNKTSQFSDINISILSLLCNLDQHQWQQIFDDKLTKEIINFIEHAKYPPLLKAASIKLLGYLVYFDNLFSDIKFKQKAYQLIFENQNDTNQNVQIRNSWALANMCCLDQSILDENILREVLISSVNYSLSTKEKVSSNGIRALGYFLKNIDEQVISQRILLEINKSMQLKQRIALSQKQGQNPIDIEAILIVIIQNLDNKSPKISWNSSVALSNLLDNETFNQLSILYSRQTINPLLNALTSRPNFKTKIHASQTLLKFSNIKALIDKQLAVKFWETMLNSIEYVNTVIPYQNDLKYLQNLEWNILCVWEQLALISMDQTDTHKVHEVRQYIASIGEFINQNSLALLQIMTSCLRKELKIPQYSGLYDEMTIKSETDALFSENPQLETKLEKLRVVIQAIREIIKNTEEVHVSFGVFESFNSLADAKVRDYRLLDTLKGIKSSFDPTSFEESKGQSSEYDSGESDKSSQV
eukprot:403333793